MHPFCDVLDVYVLAEVLNRPLLNARLYPFWVNYVIHLAMMLSNLTETDALRVLIVVYEGIQFNAFFQEIAFSSS
jgi:hypothetical protein